MLIFVIVLQWTGTGILGLHIGNSWYQLSHIA